MKITLTIRDVDVTSADAQLLIQALDDDLGGRYPGAVINSIDVDGFAQAGGVFLVGYEHGRPVACGALRPAADGTVEVKRMFVHPGSRRRGHARAMLMAIEERARQSMVAAIRLETGDRQPEAVRLYESAGYVPVPCFAEYAGSPHSRCFEKRLRPGDRIR